ncbi:MAG: ABC transporter ATP-binding protein [Thermoguttaceae bacterium]
MLCVENLTKTYPNASGLPFAAVDDVSFSVKPGEIFALLGPNGAGKTTTLRILSTVLKPSSGKVTVAGFDVETEPEEVRRRIGFMSGNTSVYDRMTGWEMVEHFGLLYGMEKEKLHEKMEILFKRLQMEEVRDRFGEKMSTGMKQKVSIARTLVHDPPVLIFDEPTAGLDVMVARSLLQTISELRNEGKCIIFSTHIMREVEKICDRVAIMDKGKILIEGTLPELRERQNQNDLEELFFELVSDK